jgi:hypothetical protein
MRQTHKRWIGAVGLSIALLAACGERNDTSAGTGITQTHFPGQVTAGGGTSGEVIVRAGGANNGAYMRGTPGIPMGSGGNTGGAATGGTVQQSTSPPSGNIPPAGEPAKNAR